MQKKTFLITSALPYANGNLHIGHIAGAYLPGDIYSRYQKSKGHDALFICGTDEHGVPISIKAKKENRPAQALVDEYYKSIKLTFENLSICFDHFSRTSSPVHYKTAQEFFLNLHRNGYIVKKEIKQFYCIKDDMFLPDRYVEGSCPKCHCEKARGDECTSCGEWMDPEALLSPRCQLCQDTPVFRNNAQWFLCLESLKEPLADWLENQVKLKQGMAKFTNEIVSNNLIDRSITRDLKWGIPVPIKEDMDKVLYVWFEAPIGYISATIEWAKQTQPQSEDEWKKYWLNKDSCVVHFIGKDNLIFHSIIWPAILLGQHEKWTLPTYIPTNQHLTIAGSKLSTSKGQIIWVDDFLKHFPADFLRYYLCIIAPENKDTNFSWSHFQEKINNELNNGLGNLANRVLNFIQKNFDGHLSCYTPCEDTFTQDWVSQIQSYPTRVGNEIDQFKMKDALQCIFELVIQGNRYFESRKPWALIRSNKTECQHVLATSVFLLKVIAGLLHPFLPNISQQLWTMCGQEMPLDQLHWDEIAHPFTKPIELGTITLLAQKIESSLIQELENNLDASSSNI